MALSVVYDPRFQDFDSWAALMCEAYGGQNLEIPSGEDNWKGWAAGLRGIDIFANEAIPDPYLFENWYDWAQAVVGAVNQRVT